MTDKERADLYEAWARTLAAALRDMIPSGAIWPGADEDCVDILHPVGQIRIAIAALAAEPKVP